MSDPTHRVVPLRTQLERRRDSGMTLPELLISISMIGLIVTALSMSVIVTMRQAPATQDRVDLARQEQSINFDMPKDLASAEEIDKTPSATPCGTSCPSNVVLDGSNAVMLTWTTTRPNASGTATVEVVTNVSYYFGPSSEPGRFELRRIECVSEGGGGWSCNTRVILDDLDGPPGGAPFLPGSTEPTWIIQVSQPLKADADSLDEVETDASALKDANRVVVTITGSGTFSGGAISQIAITAGGTSRKEIPADSTFNAPTFEQAISKCGGPVTLVLDNSGSVGGNISQVRAGAREFVKAFAGTPTQVQVIIFSSTATVLGAGSSWNKYFDLTDPAQVEELIGTGPDYTGGLIGGSWGSQGSTNWEDAMFRAFYEANGSLQKKLPERVVFFTDGEPTLERLRDRAAPGVLVDDAPPLPAPGYTKYRWTGGSNYVVDMVDGDLYSTGRTYSQVAFDRADWLADQVRGTVSMIGVGVGGITTNSSLWVQNPGARYDIRYEQGYRQYKMGTTSYQRAKGLKYQRKSGSSWQNISFSTYYPNRNNTSSYRIRWDGYPSITWQSTSQSNYDDFNFLSGNDDDDGYRYVTNEQWITKGLYDANNTGSSPDTADGYWDAGKTKVYSDSDAMDWELDLSLTADGGGIRPVEVASPTGAYAEAPDTEDTDNDVILARLVAGGDNAIRATYDAEGYATNAASANLYILPSWDKLSKALFSIAMADCGGTVTLSTKLNGGGAAPDPFTFQNSGVSTYATPPVQLDYPPTVVTTSPSYKTRTFTFDMSDGLPRYVEIIPHDLSSLTGYSPASTPWTCKAGITTLGAPDMEPVTIPGESWTGVRLKVAPNTAVSCSLNVTR